MQEGPDRAVVADIPHLVRDARLAGSAREPAAEDVVEREEADRLAHGLRRPPEAAAHEHLADGMAVEVSRDDRGVVRVPIRVGQDRLGLLAPPGSGGAQRRAEVNRVHDDRAAVDAQARGHRRTRALDDARQVRQQHLPARLDRPRREHGVAAVVSFEARDGKVDRVQGQRARDGLDPAGGHLLQHENVGAAQLRVAREHRGGALHLPAVLDVEGDDAQRGIRVLDLPETRLVAGTLRLQVVVGRGAARARERRTGQGEASHVPEHLTTG
jgi:hypothetical protein